MAAELDDEEVLCAVIDTRDEVGALRIDVKVWKCAYGPYLRYLFRVDRPVVKRAEREAGGEGGRQWLHPFSEVDAEDGGDGLRIENVVADNDATRALLRLAALSDHELTACCGNREPARYRAALIRCLRALWD